MRILLAPWKISQFGERAIALLEHCNNLSSWVWEGSVVGEVWANKGCVHRVVEFWRAKLVGVRCLLAEMVMRSEMVGGWWVRDIWLFCLVSRKVVRVKLCGTTEIEGM